MKQKIKTTKLVLLSVFAGFVYFLMLLIGVIPHVESFAEGFKEGMRIAHNAKQGKSLENEPIIPITIPLQAKKHDYRNARDTLYDERSARNHPVIIEEATLYFPQKEMPRHLSIAYNLITLPLLAFVAFSILVPIKFVEIILSVSKGDIFTRRNVKRLRLIGFYLLVIFLLSWGMSAFDYYANSILFQFEGYRIKMSFPNLMWLFFSGISFLLAEVMERAAQLKEEQELTV